MGRFRVNAFHQRGSLAAVVRVIRFGIPSYQTLGIPEEVMSVASFRQGVVLVTGQVGSGKSTTLACIVDAINHSRDGHILTLEDPIEYVHSHNRCIVSQREVYSDCTSYLSALRSAQQLVPDVNGKLIPVFEIMFVNPAIRNLIRESKTHQIDTAIQAGSAQGMRTMDNSLLTLYRQRRITKETVIRFCLNHDATMRKLNLL